MASNQVHITSAGALVPTRKGKVRDIYDLGDTLLLVASDRLSAFDVVLPDAIPDKGKVLTQVSSFWFGKLAHLIPNHLLSTNIQDFPEPFRSLPSQFAGRSMLVRKTRPLPVECVARGYLSGSGWNEYKMHQSICGIALPPGLHESDQLPVPLFTPSTKAEQGTHDENISFEDVVKLIGSGLADQLKSLTLTLYMEGAQYALRRGIIIADTKFEFGLDENGALVWIDEALTPDSSRFWPAERYSSGKAQESFDKQFVRDYLLTLQWDKRPPGPRLPSDIIEATRNKYVEALRLLTGKRLE